MLTGCIDGVIILQLVRVGAKFIILSGMFWSAGATVCFGLVSLHLFIAVNLSHLRHEQQSRWCFNTFLDDFQCG